MTHDLEGDLRDALLPLRDWETATGGAPDDLVAAVLGVVAPLEAERDELRRTVSESWQNKQLKDTLRMLGEAHKERDDLARQVANLGQVEQRFKNVGDQ